MFDREIVAYCIITSLSLVGVIWGARATRRRHRRNLRLRGIKRYEH